MHQISLLSLDDTLHLGRWLAQALPGHPGARAFLLSGPLGSGKTSLARALVEALPGGDQAEASSPSFTICNHYPTTPPVVHCDLYRCGPSLPDELLDALENPGVLTLLEWAEYLPEAQRPQEWLDIGFESCEKQRRLTLRAQGPSTATLLHALSEHWAVHSRIAHQ